MEGILLGHLENGSRITFSAIAGTRLILHFPIEVAALERSGNDMVFTFTDGSTLVLQHVYSGYTHAKLPGFEVRGQLISGEQFLTAFDRSLMPTEGKTVMSRANGGLCHNYADTNLFNGLDGNSNPATEAVLSGNSAAINTGLAESHLGFVDSRMPHISNVSIKHDMDTPGMGEGLARHEGILNITISGEHYVISLNISDCTMQTEEIPRSLTFGTGKWLGHASVYRQDQRIHEAAKYEGSIPDHYTDNTDHSQWNLGISDDKFIVSGADAPCAACSGHRSKTTNPIQSEFLAIPLTDNVGDTPTITLNIVSMTHVAPGCPIGGTEQEITDSAHDLLIGEEDGDNMLFGADGDDIFFYGSGTDTIASYADATAIDGEGRIDSPVGTDNPPLGTLFSQDGTIYDIELSIFDGGNQEDTPFIISLTDLAKMSLLDWNEDKQD